MRRTSWALGALLMLGQILPATAQTVPQFQVDPQWPKPLPNNWLVGQVASVAVDANDHVWILQRPRSLSEDEKGATLTPPRNKCCAPAPSVMEFDADGTFIQGWGFPTAKPWVANEHGIHVDRNGFVYTLDRTSGELLAATKFDPSVNWATRVDTASGRPVVEPAHSPHHLVVAQFLSDSLRL